MTKLCEQFNKIPNYSSDDVLCCDREDVDNGSGCKPSSNKNCIDPFLLTQCRKIIDLGGACERNGGNDADSAEDKASVDYACKADNNDKWLCLATNDTRDSDNHPDWDVQRNWTISGRLFGEWQPDDSRNSLVDSPISCGACCSNTTCKHMSNENYEGSCLNAAGAKKWCLQSRWGSLTTSRVKCPDMLRLGDQACQVVPFSSDNTILRTINYQADLCAGFSKGITIDQKIALGTGIPGLALTAFGSWIAWKQYKRKKNLRGINASSNERVELNELGEGTSRTITEERVSSDSEVAQQQYENQIEQPPKNSQR